MVFPLLFSQTQAEAMFSSKPFAHSVTACAFTLAAGVLFTAPAFAKLNVVFSEGAPKDRFTFTNTAACTLSGARLELDLSASSAGLIFDVTASGAGVEVFQPLEFVAGASALSTRPTVKDGDNRVVLDIAQLPAGQSIAFTIDVDYTLGGREITVNGSEIAGAQVVLSAKGKESRGAFASDAKTSVETPSC